MTSIGETLRRERVRQGLSLDQIHDRTKISLQMLRAIEQDQFDRMPGDVFARSFIRQYAHILGLDANELVGQFNHQFEDGAQQPALQEPVEFSSKVPRIRPLEDFRDRLRDDSPISALAWLIVVILVCAGGYNFWLKSKDTSNAEAAAALPRAVEGASTHAGKVKAPERSDRDFRAADVSDSGAIHVPEPPVPPGVSQPPAGVGEASRTAASATQVVLTANEPVWIRVSADGKYVYSGTLESGQRMQFGAAHSMTVRTGNAGGLDVMLNGKAVGPLGQRGEIRSVELTPEGAHILPRIPPMSPTREDSTAPAAADERP